MNVSKPISAAVAPGAEPLPGPERRRSVRYRAAGNVILRQPDETKTSFEGELLDISASGFRAVHGNNQLRSGAECEFALPGSKGRARVVWNRITPTHVESGFLILHVEAA